jgi:hypothetical protein
MERTTSKEKRIQPTGSTHAPMEVLPFRRVARARRVGVHHHQRVESPAAGDLHHRLGRHLRRPQLRPAGQLAAAVEHPQQCRRGEVVQHVADDAPDNQRIPRHVHRRSDLNLLTVAIG